MTICVFLPHRENPPGSSCCYQSTKSPSTETQTCIQACESAVFILLPAISFSDCFFFLFQESSLYLCCKPLNRNGCFHYQKPGIKDGGSKTPGCLDGGLDIGSSPMSPIPTTPTLNTPGTPKSPLPCIPTTPTKSAVPDPVKSSPGSVFLCQQQIKLSWFTVDLDF